LPEVVRIKRSAQQSGASRRSATPFRLRVVIMAKVPMMGRVKTRLAREVGAVEAVRFYRQTLAAVVARLRRDHRWEVSLAIAPDTGIASPALPHAVKRLPQGAGGLGTRMQRILDRHVPGPIIIVGTDIPAITPTHLATAFRRLRAGDAVLGPAPDGGYWLVGLKRSPRILRPFDGVRWSSPTTFADTAANLSGQRLVLAETLSDVDNAAELARCRNRFGRRVLANSD
jgi:uncharacterized protein